MALLRECSNALFSEDVHPDHSLLGVETVASILLLSDAEDRSVVCGQVHRDSRTQLSAFCLTPSLFKRGLLSAARGVEEAYLPLLGITLVRLGKTWIRYRSGFLLSKCITSILPHAMFLPVGWRTQNPSSYVQRQKTRRNLIVLGSCHHSKLNSTFE